MDPTLQESIASIRAQSPLNQRSYLQYYSKIAVLALQAGTRLEYFQKVLEWIGEACGAVYSQIQVQLPSEVIHHSTCEDGRNSGFWRSAAQQFLTESMAEKKPISRIFRRRDGIEEVAALSAPLTDPDGDALGALVLFFPCSSQDAAPWIIALSSLANFTSHCIVFFEFDEKAAKDGRDSLTLSVLERASGLESWEELVFLFVNGLKAKCGSEQVALGRVQGKRVKIVAISGMDQIKSSSPLIKCMGQAMEECLDRGMATVCQEYSGFDSSETATQYRLLRQWHEAAGGDPVACIPLRKDGSMEFVIALRRSREGPFSVSSMDRYEEMARAYIPALLLVERARRTLARHFLDTIGVWVRLLPARGRWPSKMIPVALLVLLGWFILGSMTYRVVIPGVILPRELQHISAPDGGFLREAEGLAGQEVQAGQILCRFDDREMQLELARLETELAAAVLERNRALAAGDLVAARLAEVEEERLGKLLENIRDKIERLLVRAPFSGTIVSGDLRSRLGDRLVKGEPLYQIMSSRGWMVELRVPGDRLRGIQEGQEGTFRFLARPEESHRIRLIRIAPGASQHRGKTVFLVEAEANLEGAWLRSGMEGMARVEIGRRPVWWILFHPLIDYLKMKLWI